MPTTRRGHIEAFHGSWGSGLGTIVISGIPIHCENAATVRALEGCFGNVIDEGHTASIKPHVTAEEIVYTVDDFGLLVGFTLLSEWTGHDIPDEGISEEEK
jgi:benzoyl-CoA reductase/2-hydroxyglutaryl-CoA dehydratase subunit BcrC/BadD/HgdB